MTLLGFVAGDARLKTDNGTDCGHVRYEVDVVETENGKHAIGRIAGSSGQLNDAIESGKPLILHLPSDDVVTVVVVSRGDREAQIRTSGKIPWARAVDWDRPESRPPH